MASIARALLFAWISCMLACTAPTPPEPADAPGVEAPADAPPDGPALEPVDAATEGPTLELKALRFEEAGMNLQVLDQPHSTHAWDRGGVLTQHVSLEPDYNLRVVVRVGEGEDLANVPQFRPSVEFEQPITTQLCDRPAQLLVGHSRARTIECIEFADGTPSRPGFDPAQTYVLVGFEVGGLGATAEWSVPTRYRELYRPLEQAFFAELACPS